MKNQSNWLKLSNRTRNLLEDLEARFKGSISKDALVAHCLEISIKALQKAEEITKKEVES